MVARIMQEKFEINRTRGFLLNNFLIEGLRHICVTKYGPF